MRQAAYADPGLSAAAGNSTANRSAAAMPYTILHLSDLHRSPEDPISNAVLLSSLVSDFDRSRNENPPVRLPDAIVVSGDVVQGARLGQADYASIVERQYDVALELLVALADRFVGGDRARVVVVPGNHDVDWNVARSAMEAIDDSETQKDLRPADFGPTTDLRWSWKDRRAYRIVDAATYDQRLAPFRRFLAQFYDGVDLAYPLDPTAYCQLFELNNGRIGVAALNSCYGNDCFAFHGAIPPSVLAQAHMDLRDRSPQYDLMMAVWHHNVEGPPGSCDYMDIATVCTLIATGFRLGLHGHQHRGQAINRYVHLPKQEPIAIVSAGSLCAGPIDLPTGVNRQYNVIEISPDCSSLRVHVREMAIAAVFAPARRAELGGESWIDMEIGRPLHAERPSQARANARILRAEEALAGGGASEALSLLWDVDYVSQPYARTLALRASAAVGDWERSVAILTPPASIPDLIALVDSYIQLGSFDGAETALSLHADIVGLPSATRRDLGNQIAARRALA